MSEEMKEKLRSELETLLELARSGEDIAYYIYEILETYF